MLEGIVGSRAYGLDHAASDTDRIGKLVKSASAATQDAGATTPKNPSTDTTRPTNPANTNSRNAVKSPTTADTPHNPATPIQKTHARKTHP